ncbi:hypothetical protein [Ligilactobacillus salivarius]|uniref:Uncharacterized protein n=1 Tax=Ligilactobacillus salivarius TaxID=1624 RepID=A0A2A2WZW5_9LACO|nr:hypothetical protein [Ligilactobacillus salivarius]MBX0284464.1 hypothetical protein [Ligilactobacillus salivarius]PAY27434.1 hypothetical protein A8C33_06255 [Ligilactobacillus salivarius]PAY29477.1 hypothetical protein A8C49_06125 [Ligilactobacillus salivarius]PAY30743.1 hypothetical protein A8C44_07330 [Ligilactobacillus salivarius]PAY33724.1 hypothetical protein A8C50_09650 [Ligilactobacillus salivarius]
MLNTKKSVAATTEQQKNINNINLNTLFNFTKSLDSDVEKFLVIKAFYQLNYFDLEPNDRNSLEELLKPIGGTK